MIEKSLPQTPVSYPGQNVSGKGSLRDISPKTLAGNQQEIEDVVHSLGDRKCRAMQFVQRFSEPLSIVGRDRIQSIANHRLLLRLGALPPTRIARMIVLHPDGPDTHTVGIPLDLLTGRTVEMLPKRKELIDLLEADCRLINLEHNFSCGRDFFRRRLTQEPRGRGISGDARAALVAIDEELGELTRQGVLRSRCELLDALREAPGVRHVTAFHRKVKGIYVTAENEYSFEFVGGKYSSDFPWSTAAWIGDEPAPCRDARAVAAELAELRPRVAALTARWKTVGPRVFRDGLIGLPPGFSVGVREAYDRLGGASRERVFSIQNLERDQAGPWSGATSPASLGFRRPARSPDVEPNNANFGAPGNPVRRVADAGNRDSTASAGAAGSAIGTAEDASGDRASGFCFGKTDRLISRFTGANVGPDETGHGCGQAHEGRPDDILDSTSGGSDWVEQFRKVDDEHDRKLADIIARRGRILETLRHAAAGIRCVAQGISDSLRALLGAADALRIAVDAGQQRARGPVGVGKDAATVGRGGFDLDPEPLRGIEAGEPGGAILLRAALGEFAAIVAHIAKSSPRLKPAEERPTSRPTSFPPPVMER